MTVQDTFRKAYGEFALKVHGLLSIPRARETFRRHIKEYEERPSGERRNLAAKYTRLAVLHGHCFPDEAIDPLIISDEFNKTWSSMLHLALSAGNDQNQSDTIIDLEADLADVEADLKANALVRWKDFRSVVFGLRSIVAFIVLLFAESVVFFVTWQWGAGENVLQRVVNCWVLFTGVFAAYFLAYPYVLGREGWGVVKGKLTFWK